MKAKFILILLLLLNSAMLPAQIRIDWQQCYGSMETDNAYGIIQNASGGFYVVGKVGEESGMVDCSFNSSVCSWLIEIDDMGELIEEECINHFGANYQGLKHGENNFFYLVGLGEVQYIHNVIEVRKYDFDRNLIWAAQAGDPLKNFMTTGYSATTPDGGVVVTHFTQWPCGPGGEYFGMDDAWVVKINSEGQQEWETTLGSEGEELPLTILCDSDGNLIVSIVGYPFGEGNIASCNRPLYDAIITKLSADGEIIWSRCYGGNEEERCYCITELSDGYLFAGETESDDGNFEGAGYQLGYHNGNPWAGRTTDTWLMKADFDGNIIWSKCYGGTGDDYPIKVFQNEDGGFTVFGTTKSLDGDVVSTHNLQYNNEHMQSKIWVFRTDDQGNLIWERAIGTQKRAPETVADVIKHNDKEYTIAATAYPNHFEMTGDYYCSNDTIIPYSNENFWVLHITDIFNYDDPTGIEEQPEVVPLQMKVHPNPATTWVAIDFTLPGDAKTAAVEIVNSLGEKVMLSQLNGNVGQKVLDLRELANGVYTVTVLCGEYYQTEKLVITK